MTEATFNLDQHGKGAVWTMPPQGDLSRQNEDLRFRGRDLATSFVTGSLLDELAVTNDKEPLQFLLSMLAHDQGADPELWGGIPDTGGSLSRQYPMNVARMRNVLLLVAARSGWRSPLPLRQGRGIAAHHAPHVHIASVARVAVADDGRVNVPRIHLAVDCGWVPDPDRVTEALRKDVLGALSATLRHRSSSNESHNKDQGSELDDAPDIRIHIVRSEGPSGSLVEAGAPPVMAALVNAVFAATGQRAWVLPVDPALLRLHRVDGPGL